MKAKKSLGQNFLQSQSALTTIVKESEIKKNDFVLEIGPGKGALTEKILGADAQLVAVEKDFELIDFLKEKFYEQIQSNQLVLINKDILEFDESNLPEEYKLIANIPYYITGQIIRKFLSAENQPSKIVLLVQKEVADRIISNPEKNGSDKHPKNKENLLSLSVKVYAEPKFVRTVPAGSFVPAPKIDSAIISLNKISKNSFQNISDKTKVEIGAVEEMFFKLIRSGFAHKRKTLFSNLKKTGFLKENQLNSNFIENFFEEKNIDQKIRAEDLKLEDWLCLTEKIFI